MNKVPLTECLHASFRVHSLQLSGLDDQIGIASLKDNILLSVFFIRGLSHGIRVTVFGCSRVTTESNIGQPLFQFHEIV